MPNFDQRISVELPNERRRPILTIGTAVYDSYPQLALTLMGLLHGHPEILPDVEFVVLDNNPTSGHGHDTREFVTKKLPHGHYATISPYSGTYIKDLVVRAAQTEYVMVMDSHITFPAGSLAKLIQFLKRSHPTNDLFQGPIVEPNGTTFATHMNPGMGSYNFGRWGTYRGDKMETPDMYQVPLHGTGLFVVRRDSWLGFHPAMHHFGSEEGYIHEKYRLHGRTCWSLPFLKWWHLFLDKSRDIKYTMPFEHKYRNMLIGWQECSLPLDWVEKAFEPAIKEDKRKAIRQNVDTLGIVPIRRPEGQLPFLGYPLRLLDKPYEESVYFLEYETPIFVDREI